jgi:hypothetical protein
VRVPGGPNRKYIESILKKGLEQQPVAAQPSRGVMPVHENVRGADYYETKDIIH